MYAPILTIFPTYCPTSLPLYLSLFGPIFPLSLFAYVPLFSNVPPHMYLCTRASSRASLVVAEKVMQISSHEGYWLSSGLAVETLLGKMVLISTDIMKMAKKVWDVLMSCMTGILDLSYCRFGYIRGQSMISSYVHILV